MNPKDILLRAAHSRLARDLFDIRVDIRDADVTENEITDLLARRLTPAQAADVRRRLTVFPAAAARVAKMEEDIARSLQPEPAAAMQARLDAVIAAARVTLWDPTLTPFEHEEVMALAAKSGSNAASQPEKQKEFELAGKDGSDCVRVEVWRELLATALVFIAKDPALAGSRVLFEFGAVRGEVALADTWGIIMGKVRLDVSCEALLAVKPRFNLIKP